MGRYFGDVWCLIRASLHTNSERLAWCLFLRMKVEIHVLWPPDYSNTLVCLEPNFYPFVHSSLIEETTLQASHLVCEYVSIWSSPALEPDYHACWKGSVKHPPQPTVCLLFYPPGNVQPSIWCFAVFTVDRDVFRLSGWLCLFVYLVAPRRFVCFFQTTVLIFLL